MLFNVSIKISLLLILFAANVAPSQSEDNKNSTSRIRLPSAIKPTEYLLHINTKIHQDVREFSGNVTIYLTVNEPTDEIILHAKFLYNFEVTLTNLKTNEQVHGLEHVHEHKLNFLRIFSQGNPLSLQPEERYRLEISYTGEHQESNFGFYRDTYLDDNGVAIPLAITQFEPTSARVAFPCFDEPHIKAKFVISITHGSNYTALSNMPVEGTPIKSTETQMTTTTFQKTPKMSTYLIAFAVSNFHHNTEFINGREYGVYFPPNCKDNGSNALKNGVNSLTALEQYFGIEYPLPKLDHIRVEKTYGIAMENWGLLTYNSKNFVTNIRNNSWEEMQKIISQNHEIAHQWFGNLVTPEWWTYVWLKEGFAVYFSYVATQLVFPEKNIDEYFILKEYRDVFRHYLQHPLTVYVEQEDEIRKAYNLISYRFGSCFVRMFHHAIGHKTFVKGVASYLRKFQYSVANENDLFEALQVAVDEDQVKLFQNNKTAVVLRSWTHNTGFPKVFVTRNFDTGTLTLRQESRNKGPFSDQKWWIPLSFATASNPDFEKTTADYIMPPESTVIVSLEDLNLNISNSDWLIVDKQQTGLYQVLYDTQSIALIAEALRKNHTQIHRFNRAKLIRDLATIEDGVETLFDVLQFLQFEDDLMVWESAADLIYELYIPLQGRKSHEQLKPLMRDLIAKIFHKIFINPPQNDPTLTVHEAAFRDKVLKIACEVDLDECLSFTRKLTSDYFLNELSEESLKSDYTLCQGLKAAAFEDFKKLVNKVTTPDGSVVKFYEFLFSLKCVKSLENIRYFLEVTALNANNNGNVQRFSKNSGLSMLYLLNVEARPMIYEFLMEKDKTTAAAIREAATYMENGMKNEMSSRKTFQNKYDARILTWLEKNYESNRMLDKEGKA